MTSLELGAADTRSAGPRRPRAWHLGDAVLPLVTVLAFVFLLVPIVYTVVFSFNDAFKSNLVWRGFTWNNWAHPCGAPQVCQAFTTSLQVGALATAVATTLGTLMAVALVRFRFRGRTAVNLLIFLPMTTPEVVLGSALAAQFLTVGTDFGFWTIVAAHVMFCLSFVVVTVKARVASLDPVLEEAAADLYASPVAAFWRVTLPLLLPGIAAAALLSFILSIDDYIVTSLNAGSVVKTFPMFIYISANRGIPPQANVWGTVMFVVALLVVVASQVGTAWRRRRRTTLETTSRPAPAARVPARPVGLVRPRPAAPVVPAGRPASTVPVAGLGQAERPFALAVLGLVVTVAGVVGCLAVLLRIPNAHGPDLTRLLLTLAVTATATITGALITRGRPKRRAIPAPT